MKQLPEVPKCKKCGRTCFPIETVKTDPKTKKKWYITACPKCNYESDLSEYDENDPFQ